MSKLQAEQRRATTLSERVFEIQQECARLDFMNRGQDKTAKWVAEELVAALAEFELLEPALVQEEERSHGRG